MTDIEVLRIAAIMAVLQIVNDGENEADVGREYGEAWAQRSSKNGRWTLFFAEAPNWQYCMEMNEMTENKKVEVDGVTFDVELEADEQGWKATVEGKTFMIKFP